MATEKKYEIDRFATPAGEIAITFLGHGSLLFDFQGMAIYVDPFSRVANYASLPKADLIFLTHEHQDHLDLVALAPIQTRNTTLVLTSACARQLGTGLVMQNGDERDVRGIHVWAVAAYNRVHHRDNGQPFHPKGVGNGYILVFGDRRIYVAGDTEDIPEMKGLGKIDIAFLPMNLPYTMTPEMVVEAAKMIRPAVLYPYHYGQTDPARLVELLKSEPGIEVRIRNLS